MSGNLIEVHGIYVSIHLRISKEILFKEQIKYINVKEKKPWFWSLIGSVESHNRQDEEHGAFVGRIKFQS